jgi:hypothetical protein
MMVGYLELAQKLVWASQIFDIPYTIQTCCKTQRQWIPFPTIQNHALDVSSGLACFGSCGLVIMLLVGYLELAQKLVWASQIFLIPHRPNQPAARHGSRGFPSQQSKIMHWMYQVAWHVFEAVVWSL